MSRLSALLRRIEGKGYTFGSHAKPRVIPKYHINLFWSDEEQAWVADVPDLEPCATFGASRAEALVKAEELIDLWLESARSNGDSIPEPRYRPAFYAFHAA